MALRGQDRNDRQRGLPFGEAPKLPSYPLPIVIPPLLEEVTIRTQRPDTTELLSAGHPRLVARVLAARGLAPGEEMDKFFHPRLDRLPDPRAATGGLRFYEEGVALVRRHVMAGGLVSIATDFDADGTTAGAQLALFLKSIGAPYHYMVPDRFTEGYGLNTRMIDEAARRGASLIVVFDMGTKNTEAIRYAQQKKIQVFVVDHHVSSDIDCPADVLWNPHQKGCGFAGGDLAATGLSFFLVNGLRRAVPGGDWFNIAHAAQLAAIGTLADMVPLSDPNRILVSYGLSQLSNEHLLIGLRELLDLMKIRGRSITSGQISYGVGPRINAAGRMADAETVLDLLTTEDPRTAYQAARTIDHLNRERQRAEDEVKAAVGAEIGRGGVLPPALVVAVPQLHVGVVGIVAQRLVESYGRPALVLTNDSEGELKGSGRSVEGFNLIESLERAAPLLTKFGGHPRAAGLTLPGASLTALRAHLEKEASAALSASPVPKITVDTCGTLDEMNLECVRALERLGPFGTGNPTPKILVPHVTVTEMKEIHKGKHVRITLQDSTGKKQAVAYRLNTLRFLEVGATFDVVVTPGFSPNGEDCEVTLLSVRPRGASL